MELEEMAWGTRALSLADAMGLTQLPRKEHATFGSVQKDYKMDSKPGQYIPRRPGARAINILLSHLSYVLELSKQEFSVAVS